jgi:hypothetical protein
MNIPFKIYSYVIIISIILILAVSMYLYVLPKSTKFEKTFIIWFTIIIELNLIHLYYILQFYNTNLNKKGLKGPSGDVGPRGFKGYSENCSSCGSAGAENVIFGGIVNDKGKLDKSSNAKRGKCQFPFIHNHQYVYSADGCIKNYAPPGHESNYANIDGWCATETDNKKNVVKYGYCNENETIQNKMARNKDYMDKKQQYIDNNYGILDVEIVEGNTKSKAISNCDKKGADYSILDQDLNDGVEGKFLYLCNKTGFGSLGIGDLRVVNDISGKPPYKKDFKVDDDDKSFKIVGGKKGIDLNKDSTSTDTQYMYKHATHENFYKELKILTDDAQCEDEENWDEIHGNLNDGSTENVLKLCGSKLAGVNKIDMAFNYKGKLYIFYGPKFYKMTRIPIQESLKVEDGYSNGKLISERWFSGDDCTRFSIPTDCNKNIKCMWNANSSNSGANVEGICEGIIYHAAFTYGYDNKTYFFNGGNVFKYNDKQMKIEADYPKPINDVFKGVPDNIDAVFTWAKDGVTYFFKGETYYKYNDKKQEIESGYPRKSKDRWGLVGDTPFPTQISAIFSLDFSLGEQTGDSHPTYVIDGNGQSYYVDPVTDALKSKKPIDDRFKGMFDLENMDSDNST